ncbi:MAG: histidine phosphatase family protein [Coriobacteriia bacterium]|nr:histidine phosphatase family protein [Coriobacteriia bacterium]
MRITLLRHAKTQGNLEMRYVGRTDEPLSQEGISFAESLEADTSVKRVFTSALLRTKQTALLLFPRAKIIPLEGLNEMDFGVFEGRSAMEMVQDKDYQAWVDKGCEDACPGGESMESFTLRCTAAFLEAASRAAEEGSESEAFVTHGGVIMAIMGTLALPLKPRINWMAANCGGFVVDYNKATREERPLRVLESIRDREWG